MMHGQKNIKLNNTSTRYVRVILFY